jgi:hypothetical protein
MRYIHIVSNTGLESYDFYVFEEDEEYWWSRNGVRFPKHSFTER